ncbi:YhfC family intramembrane metalloprotease [Paenibacillus ginsengihumi]|uniref:YhfC family intramembrane metalloprotease n=1 Tax=Paenibacillus ginsengihumi TaxID=431596 RepID=UPI00037CFF3F|nr:YhfC family intramembrane metalloprotease [Paenibacillus ginsengihumi]
MVSAASIAGIIIQMASIVILVASLFVYFRKTERIGWLPLLAGMAVFLLFSQLLEKVLHVYMLQGNAATAKALQNPWLFAAYGALAAGVFEELGRYIGFRFWLKRRRSWSDGIAFGFGHGGLEALLLGVVGGAQMLGFALMINSGTFDQALGSAMPGEAMQQIKAQLTDTPWALYLVAAWERIPALLLHLALSIMVLHGVRSGRFRHVVAAIALHAAVDFLPALYQAKVLPLAVVELGLIPIAAAFFIYLRHMRRKYRNEWSRE